MAGRLGRRRGRRGTAVALGLLLSVTALWTAPPAGASSPVIDGSASTGAVSPGAFATDEDGFIWFSPYSATDAPSVIARINPLAPNDLRIFEVHPPGQPNVDLHPLGLAAGPAGSDTMWFAFMGDLTACTGQSDVSLRCGGIGRISTDNPVVNTDEPELFTVGSGAQRTYDVVRGPQGRMWFTNYIDGTIGSLDPLAPDVAGTINAFRPPAPDDRIAKAAAELTVANGDLWYTIAPNAALNHPDGANISTGIGSYDPDSGAFRKLRTGTVPDRVDPVGFGTPIGIVTAGDGFVWFQDSSGRRLGRFDPANPGPLKCGFGLACSITLFDHAGFIDERSVSSTLAQPNGIGVAPDGGIWITNLNDRAALVTPVSHSGSVDAISLHAFTNREALDQPQPVIGFAPDMVLVGATGARRIAAVDRDPSCAQVPHEFSDVGAAAAVNWGRCHAITPGRPSSQNPGGARWRFEPNAATTTRQALTWIWTMLDQPPPANAGDDPSRCDTARDFGDAPSGDTPNGTVYRRALSWAADTRVFTGRSVGIDECRHGIDTPLTRAGFLVRLWRAMGSPTGFPPHGFTDPGVPRTGPTAKALNWADATGVVPGTRVKPNDAATHLIASTWLYRVATRPVAWGSYAGQPPSTFVP